MRCTLVLAIGVTFSMPAVAQFDGLFDGSPDHPSIDYADRPTKDPVAELNRKVGIKRISIATLRQLEQRLTAAKATLKRR